MSCTEPAAMSGTWILPASNATEGDASYDQVIWRGTLGTLGEDEEEETVDSGVDNSIT